jgi:hypothetical protein
MAFQHAGFKLAMKLLTSLSRHSARRPGLRMTGVGISLKVSLRHSVRVLMPSRLATSFAQSSRSGCMVSPIRKMLNHDRT